VCQPRTLRHLRSPSMENGVNVEPCAVIAGEERAPPPPPVVGASAVARKTAEARGAT